MWKKIGFGLVAFAFFAAASVSAHTNGASLEQVVGNIVIDIGHSPSDIIANTPVPFDFGLYRTDTGEEVLYESIWVRIYQGRDVLYAGGLHRSAIGATTMLYQFPREGTYTLSARFQDDSSALAEATFTIPVSEEVVASSSKWRIVLNVVYATALLLGLSAGVLGTRYLLKRKLHIEK